MNNESTGLLVNRELEVTCRRKVNIHIPLEVRRQQHKEMLKLYIAKCTDRLSQATEVPE